MLPFLIMAGVGLLWYLVQLGTWWLVLKRGASLAHGRFILGFGAFASVFVFCSLVVGSLLYGHSVAEAFGMSFATLVVFAITYAGFRSARALRKRTRV
jgi:hypothetical protein